MILKKLTMEKFFWRSWEKAMVQQVKRFHSKRNHNLLHKSLSQSISEEINPKVLSKTECDASSNYLLCGGSPSPLVEEKDQENFNDPTIGMLSWIPSGEITITVPIPINKVVHVKHGLDVSDINYSGSL